MSILADFNTEMKRRRVRLHGAVLVRGGEVIDEVYNCPYTARTKTRMYSASKSVAAVAIGKLVGEGRLSLDDRVVDIFADRFDMSGVHPLLREQTVRQMLTMTTCFSGPTYDATCKDWLASYFRARPTHPAGTVWHYDSSGSYVLGAITKHLTGLDYVEYLRPEFDVMGVSEGVYSLRGPDGEAWASSGFIAETSDLAKIAYLLLNNGRWGTRQLIPESYATEARSPLVRNDDKGVASRFDCGYGYQVWSHPDGAFAFRGLGGQIAIGFPGRDLVFACNCDSSCNHNAYDDVFDAVENMIAAHFPLTDPAEYERAQRPPVTHTAIDEIIGKSYALEQNPMGIERISFTRCGEDIHFNYLRDGVLRSIAFSTDGSREIIFPESYSGEMLFDTDHFVSYRCTTEAEWLEPRKLSVWVWAEDVYVGNMSMAFAFTTDGRVTVKMAKHAQFFFDGFEGFAYGSAADCV